MSAIFTGSEFALTGSGLNLPLKRPGYHIEKKYTCFNECNTYLNHGKGEINKL